MAQTIDFKLLLEYRTEHKILYASDRLADKRIYVTLSGNYEVWHKDKIIYEGTDTMQAVYKYNEI